MASEPKTKPTGASVDDFLRTGNPKRADEGFAAKQMLEEITGEPAEMWGPSIVGFGRYSYIGPNKKPVEWPMIGFSPRKAEFVFYFKPEFEGREELLAKVGKYRDGVSCVYFKKLADADPAVLRQLAEASYRATQAAVAAGGYTGC